MNKSTFLCTIFFSDKLNLTEKSQGIKHRDLLHS